MLAAIKLDDQFCTGAVKVNNVVADSFLPVKLHILELLFPDFRPKQSFCISHIFSQPPRIVFQLFVIE